MQFMVTGMRWHPMRQLMSLIGAGIMPIIKVRWGKYNLPGYTEGSINILAMEPEVDSTSLHNKGFDSLFELCRCRSCGERRTVALMSVSDEAGYYVDIFRSDLEDNDFCFIMLAQHLP